MRLCVAVLLLLAAVAASAETIDRIILVVARHPITELQLEEELRVTSFLNEEPLVRDLAQRRKAADRLVDQALVQREMRLTHFSMPSSEDIDAALKQLEEEQGGPDSFSRALARNDLTPSEVRQHLALQIATIRFIAFRFRPEFTVQEDAVEQAYRKERSAWSAAHPGQPLPTLEASRASLSRRLLEQQTDTSMNEWLEQARKQVHIAYLDPSLETQAK